MFESHCTSLSPVLRGLGGLRNKGTPRGSKYRAMAVVVLVQVLGKYMMIEYLDPGP